MRNGHWLDTDASTLRGSEGGGVRGAARGGAPHAERTIANRARQCTVIETFLQRAGVNATEAVDRLTARSQLQGIGVAQLSEYMSDTPSELHRPSSPREVGGSQAQAEEDSRRV